MSVVGIYSLLLARDKILLIRVAILVTSCETHLLNHWSGFKCICFCHVGAMALRGWPSVFQDSVRNMVPCSVLSVLAALDITLAFYF